MGYLRTIAMTALIFTAAILLSPLCMEPVE